MKNNIFSTSGPVVRGISYPGGSPRSRIEPAGRTGYENLSDEGEGKSTSPRSLSGVSPIRHHRALTSPDLYRPIPPPPPSGQSQAGTGAAGGPGGIGLHRRLSAKPKPKRTFIIRDIEESDLSGAGSSSEMTTSRSILNVTVTTKTVDGQQVRHGPVIVNQGLNSPDTGGSAASGPGTPARSPKSPNRRKGRRYKSRKEVKVGRFTITEFEPASPGYVSGGSNPSSGDKSPTATERPQKDDGEYDPTGSGPRERRISEPSPPHPGLEDSLPSRYQYGGGQVRGSSTGSRWIPAHSAARTARQHLQKSDTPRDRDDAAKMSPKKDDHLTGTFGASGPPAMAAHAETVGQLKEVTDKSSQRLALLQGQVQEVQKQVSDVVRNQSKMQDFLLEIFSQLQVNTTTKGPQEPLHGPTEFEEQAKQMLDSLRKSVEEFASENQSLRTKLKTHQTLLSKQEAELKLQTEELTKVKEVNKELRAKLVRLERKIAEEHQQSASAPSS